MTDARAVGNILKRHQSPAPLRPSSKQSIKLNTPGQLNTSTTQERYNMLDPMPMVPKIKNSVVEKTTIESITSLNLPDVSNKQRFVGQ